MGKGRSTGPVGLDVRIVGMGPEIYVPAAWRKSDGV